MGRGVGGLCFSCLSCYTIDYASSRGKEGEEGEEEEKGSIITTKTSARQTLYVAAEQC